MKLRLFFTLLLTFALTIAFSTAEAKKSKVDYQRALRGDKCLCRSNLEGANFEHKSLSCADLRYSNLHKADLDWADLRGANLCGADLSKADLEGADLRGACLAGANLADVEIENTIWIDGRILNPD